MTLKLIDQALNVALTSLLYGSEAWLALAFALYIATHKKKKEIKAAEAILQPSVSTTVSIAEAVPPAAQTAENKTAKDKPLANKTAENKTLQKEVLKEKVPQTSASSVAPEINLETEVKKAVEKIAHQKTARAQSAPEPAKPKAKTRNKTVPPPSTPSSPPSGAPKPLTAPAALSPGVTARPHTTTQPTSSVQTAAKAAFKKKVVLPRLPKVANPEIIASPEISPQEISCEPVNWKKWKVSDLRKASMARVCGVRMTPIGSRRKLSKADLIAQYEQNLKRMTKPPMAQAPRATSAFPQPAKRVV